MLTLKLVESTYKLITYFPDKEHRNARVSLRLGMGLTVCVGAARNTHPVSPTHPYDRRETEATQRHKQAEKGSWLKQVGKVPRVVKVKSDRQGVGGGSEKIKS